MCGTTSTLGPWHYALYRLYAVTLAECRLGGSGSGSAAVPVTTTTSQWLTNIPESLHLIYENKIKNLLALKQYVVSLPVHLLSEVYL